MSTDLTRGTPQIVINWHVTEACNFRCRYCYAHWKRATKPDLIRDPAGRRALLEELFGHFASRCLQGRPRLNFAGGEPLLFADEVCRAMQEARRIGFDISMITNGSRLSIALVEEIAPMLSMLGVSLDSAHAETLTEVGRHDSRGHQMQSGSLAPVLARARRIKPDLELKINTVVCRANWREDMSDVIRVLAPSRWKILRMLPVINGDLAVTDAQFHAFVSRHRQFAAIANVENNDDMLGSYIMVDPMGRFFQNRVGASGYDYSLPILQVGATQAFSNLHWSEVKFERRYRAEDEGASE